MFSTNRKMIVHLLGAITGFLAISPLVYAKFNNVKDTGDEAADNLAEGVHDMAMGFLTFYTTFKALIFYVIARVVIMMIPDSVLGDKSKD